MNNLLNLGASGVRAYQTALSTVSSNVSNAETPGYVKRSVQLNEIGAGTADPYHLGGGQYGGVATGDSVRSWDEFLTSDARLSSSDAARATTRQRWLESAETGLDDGDAGVGAKLTAFFNSATTLSSDPGAALPRTQMIGALGDAATTINRAATSLSRISTAIGSEASATAKSINDDLAALAGVNTALKSSVSGSSTNLSLADERDRIVDGLSSKIGIETKLDAHGAATVTLAGSAAGSGGTALLDGNAINLVAVSQGSDGRLAMSVGGVATAIAPTGGSLAGLVDAAAAVSTSRATLDQVAVQFRDGVNGWNAQGRTSSGAAGGALLAGTTAATLAVAGGVTGASIAARGSDGSANGNLAGLSALRGGDGVEVRIEGLIGTNAQLLASTKSEAAAATTRSDTATTARDKVSAVDLNQEAADMLRYQQAYDASARVLQVAKETLQSIFDVMR